MRPLTTNNVQSELSYAYLHAVAARASMACQVSGRHEDDHGVDARLTAWGRWPDAYRTEVELKVQLKATTGAPADSGSHLSYWLAGRQRYDDLRSESLSVPRVLVVLFLPEDAAHWVGHSEDALLLRRCAYWVSLLGAPSTDNHSGATIHLPKTQVFSPEGLHALVARLARRDLPRYQAP